MSKKYILSVKKAKNKQDLQNQIVDIDETAILEYLDTMKNEYEIEISKKQSFENRAGLILALLGAISVFILENVQLKEIFSILSMPVSFYDFTKIVFGFSIYAGFLFTIIMIIKTIALKRYGDFQVKNIKEDLLRQQKIVGVCKIIFTYRDIILQHREMNKKRAKALQKSLYGITFTFIGVIIYCNYI